MLFEAQARRGEVQLGLGRISGSDGLSGRIFGIRQETAGLPRQGFPENAAGYPASAN